jgi:hypothetical protein
MRNQVLPGFCAGLLPLLLLLLLLGRPRARSVIRVHIIASALSHASPPRNAASTIRAASSMSVAPLRVHPNQPRPIVSPRRDVAAAPRATPRRVALPAPPQRSTSDPERSWEPLALRAPRARSLSRRSPAILLRGLPPATVRPAFVPESRPLTTVALDSPEVGGYERPPNLRE